MNRSDRQGPNIDSSSESSLRRIRLYTDGACKGNPGPGGWAYILEDAQTGNRREGSGGERPTTNNRMELRAVIEGLSALRYRCEVELYSDSQYVLNGLKSWMAGWKRNGWRRKTSGGWESVKNDDLWKRLDQLMTQHAISFHHVRGHSGHPENERCDVLAVAAAAEAGQR